MKYLPSNILNEIEKNFENITPILFYGNEEGLISWLTKSIYNILQKKLGVCDIKYFDHKHDKNNELQIFLKSSTLFSKINLIVLNNPQVVSPIHPRSNPWPLFLIF